MIQKLKKMLSERRALEQTVKQQVQEDWGKATEFRSNIHSLTKIKELQTEIDKLIDEL